MGRVRARAQARQQGAIGRRRRAPANQLGRCRQLANGSFEMAEHIFICTGQTWTRYPPAAPPTRRRARTTRGQRRGCLLAGHQIVGEIGGHPAGHQRNDPGVQLAPRRVVAHDREHAGRPRPRRRASRPVAAGARKIRHVAAHPAAVVRDHGHLTQGPVAAELQLLSRRLERRSKSAPRPSARDRAQRLQSVQSRAAAPPRRPDRLQRAHAR
jgi:hypothetical protein